MTASTQTTTAANIQTARKMYEAFGRGDLQAMLDLVTDDVDWSTDAAIESAPWYGPRHGKGGVASFFQAIGSTGPVTEFTPLAITSNDDGDVVAQVDIGGTQQLAWGLITPAGQHYREPHLFIFGVGPDLLIDDIAAYWNDAGISQQLGHNEVD